MVTTGGPLDKAFIAMGIISWIGGGAVFALALVLVLDEDTLDQVSLLNDGDAPLTWQATVYMFAVVGGYTFVIGFVGWIGHLYQNKQTLLAYIVLGTIASAALLSNGFLATVYMLDVRSDETKNALNESMTAGNATPWYDYQTKFQCCGIEGKEDWLQFPEYSAPDTYPVSCCSESLNNTCVDWFSQGCYTVMTDGINFDTALIMGLSFGVFALQLSGTAIGGVVFGSNRISPVG